MDDWSTRRKINCNNYTGTEEKHIGQGSTAVLFCYLQHYLKGNYHMFSIIIGTIALESSGYAMLL